MALIFADNFDHLTQAEMEDFWQYLGPTPVTIRRTPTGHTVSVTYEP